MLNVKHERVIDKLIELVELDNFEEVRIASLKAIFKLAYNNPKVQQTFNKLDRNSNIYK